MLIVSEEAMPWDMSWISFWKVEVAKRIIEVVAAFSDLSLITGSIDTREFNVFTLAASSMANVLVSIILSIN